MKSILRCFGFIFTLMFAISLTSCVGDSCYVCTSNGGSLIDTTVCDGIDGTSDEIKELRDLYETAGGNCDRQ